MGQKIQAFEYFIYCLLQWHKEATGKSQNDISVLKALKLLFFVAAVNTDRRSTNTLLDKVFNNFVAMPYGPVESDVYSNIRNNMHRNIAIDNKNSAVVPDYDSNSVDKEIKDLVNLQIISLKKVNSNLITWSSFDLVDLSHMYYSWQVNFKCAQKMGLKSYPIDINEIKSEAKIYQL